MSIYRCNDCENFIDDDWFPCVEDPNDKCEVICPDCHEETIDDED